MSVGEIQVKLGLDASNFSTGLLAAKAQALALGGSLGDIGKAFATMGSSAGGSLSKVGTLMTSIGGSATVLTAGLVALGAAAVVAGTQMAKMAADYQTAMAKVGATTGMSNDALKEMQGLMYQNAATGSRLSMSTQASIAAGLGGAGLIGPNTSPEEQLAQLKLVEQAMVALEAPTDDVIQLFSTLQTRYGSNSEGMSRTASAIAQMADETAASNSEIIQATGTMGRLASTVIMSQPEMVALAAATKSAGIAAAEVGTQWSSLTRNLAGGSKESAAAFEELGMSQDDWFKAMQDSKNTGSNAPVLKFLKELDSRLQKSDNSAKLSMQLYGSYGAVLGGSMSQVISKYDELVVKSQTAYDENVRLTQEYERMTNTMNSMLDAIGAKFNAVGVQLGTALLAPLQDATYQFDQFLGRVMQGDLGGAFYNLYSAVFNYDWFGAGAQIASMIASGLGTLAEATGQALYQLANVILTHDWIGSGRSIASQIVSGLSNIGTMARGALDDISSWVSSGGARSAGESLANWIISGAQSVFGAGVDLLGWLRNNLTMDKVSGIVRSAFEMGSELVSLGVQVGSDFLSGISTAISDKAGNYFSGIKTAASELVGDISNLGVNVARAGMDLVIKAVDGVLATIAGVLNPILAVANQIAGTNYSVPTSTGWSAGSYDVGGAWSQFTTGLGELGSAANPFGGGMVNPTSTSPFLSQYKNVENDPMALFRAYAAAGMTYEQAMAQFNRDLKGKVFQTSSNFNLPSEQVLRPLFGGGTSTGSGIINNATSSLLSGGAGNPFGFGLWNSSNVPWAAGGAAAAGATTGATSALASQWTGGTVPVFVTNWEGAAGAAAAGTATTSVNKYGQTVDANGLPVGKFDASKINTTGPGIGMVATEGGKGQAYANRLEIDTCEIDSFGMTPGLGAELAASGAWRPNAGAASQKLAAEIGYGGDYADPSQYGAIMGTMNQIVRTQNTTATKVSGITVGAATKATGITIGGMQQASYSFQAGTTAAAKTAGNTIEASALNAKVSLEDGAYSCFNSYGEMALTWEQEIAKSIEEDKAGSVIARDNIIAGGQHVKENSLTSSLDFKNNVDTAGTDFKNNIASGAASWGSALGSGLTSLSQIASYVTGGTSTMYGGGYTSAGNGITQTPWGAGSFGGTSIGGGGSWVGTGASYSGAGAMAVSGQGFTSSNGVRWFADGGIITKPSIVGVGEAGTEAIVPIGKLPEMLANITGGGSSGGAHSHAIYIDGKKVADAVGPAMVKRMQQGAGLKVR